MKNKAFHLSIGCKSIDESVHFFKNILNSEIVHKDSSGYVNIDFYGTQITLKSVPTINPEMEELHFGVNLSLKDFEVITQAIIETGYDKILGPPKTVDTGTPMERRKMYVKCPTGYIFEFKGYQ